MDDQPTPTSKSRWRLPTYETERAQKWGRGALIAGVLGVLAMLGGSLAGTWVVLGGIAAHLAARRMDRGVAPVASLGELTQWRPRSNQEKGWLGFAALLAVVGLGAFGGSPPPPTIQPQGIADQQQLAATAEPGATRTPRPTSTPRPTKPPATATDEPEPTATDEPPTAVPPTDLPTIPPPPTDIPGPPHPDLDAHGDVNCSDFSSHADAQRWWDYWRTQSVSNPGGLDGDGDNDVCESR